MKVARAWLFTLFFGLSLAAVSSRVEAENSAATETAADDLFSRLYSASLENLGRPDLTFTDLETAEAGVVEVIPVASSKTCSQRCSTRCSVGCTTTRGCSRACKAQTEGCGGVVSDRTNDVQAAPAVAASLGPMPRSTTKRFTTTDLQMLLKIAGYDVVADGKLGTQTYAAVSDFQSRNGLVATGTADAAVWKQLCAVLVTLTGEEE